MIPIDLVFEGGGAKGMVFVGALEELFRDGAHTHGRLLGTSAGAITAVVLAAGYSSAEMMAALCETDAAGKPVFTAFLGQPGPYDLHAVRQSQIREVLREVNTKFIPDFAEDRVDDWLAEQIAGNPFGSHIFSFVEQGGWYAADAFVAWLRAKLNEGQFAGRPRAFGDLTLAQFYEQTQTELTLVAADTTASRMLLLNHRTAPDCPVVWATRMSMSVPLLWQEVVWQSAWGCYAGWDPDAKALVPEDITGHAIVDGGLLSNFPIALLMSDSPDVAAVMGPPGNAQVLGLLIDESLPVPNHPPARTPSGGFDYNELRSYQRLHRLMNTALSAHDNMAIAVFAHQVVHLPAQGYGTTQFDMTVADRDALVEGGRQAMQAFLRPRPGARPLAVGPTPDQKALANQAALQILKH